MSALDLILEDERAGVAIRLAEHNTEPYKLKLLRKDRESVYVYVSPRNFLVSGEVYRVAEFVDYSIEERIRNRLEESKEKFHSVFEQAAVGIARVSPTGVWLEVNQKLCDILGYSRRELVKKTFQDITYPDDLESDLTLMEEILQDKRQSYNMDKRYFNKNGDIVWCSLTSSLLRSADGEPKYFIVVIQDISLRKEMESELVTRATHDSLTGLANRSQLASALEKEMARAVRYTRPLSILMIDIDHFKLVNDNYGHQAGDHVLVELSEILNIETRATDVACRFGGEEFLLMLPELDHEQALQLADRIRRTVELHKITYQEDTFCITVSIGVASYPEHGDNADNLVRASDDAMYRAKNEGRNRTASATH